MPNRTILAVILSITLFATVYNLYFYTSSYDNSMAAPDSPRQHESVSSLQFTLEQVITAKVPTLRVHLRNSSPYPFTVLNWATPLDPGALNQDVFKVTDADSGDIVKGPGIKVSRVQPPPKDAFVEIPAGEEITKDVPLTASWIPKKKLKFAAHGRWHAVWEKKMSDIPRAELDSLKNAMRDEFTVREVEVDLTPLKKTT